MAIGETSAVSVFLDPIKFRHEYLHLNNSWNRIHLEHDVLSYSGDEHIFQCKLNLAASGLYGLAHRLTPSTLTSSSSYSSEMEYNCAWRLGDWNLLVDGDDLADVGSFEKQHFLAMKCLKIKDELGAVSAIKLARQSIIDYFKHASFECTNNIYSKMMCLTLVQQIEDFCEVSLLQ